MSIAAGDHSIVRWAERHGLRYYYTPARPWEAGCLRVHLGHVTADFGDGKLVRLNVQSDSRSLDDTFQELTHLFDLCRRVGAYADPDPAVTAVEKNELFGPGNVG